MLDDNTPTPASKAPSGKIGIKKLIDASTTKSKRQPKFKTNEFDVRPSSAAICQTIAGGNVYAGNLLLGLLELWIGVRKKVERPYGGGVRPYLFLPVERITQLTGIGRDKLYKRAFPPLKERAFLTTEIGRLIHGGPTMCQLYVDTDAVWSAVVGELGLAEATKTKANGVTFDKWAVDRRRLPVLFKRLYDEADGQVPQ